MTLEEKICNAKIRSTCISMADHAVLTFDLDIETCCSACDFGCYVIGHGYLGTNEFTVSGTGLAAMMRIIDTVGVEKWGDLPGKLIRIVDPGLSGRLTKIGNILEDKWFDIDEFLKARGEGFVSED